MKTITQVRAQQIASNWHGGQWSALYQFASSGIIIKENILLYIQECIDCLNHQETAPHPYTLPIKQQKELESLINYFKKQQLGVNIIESKHSFYGYRIITTDTPHINLPVFPQ